MRKFLSLLMAVVFGVSTVFATTVYCKMEHSWWTQDGAAVAVHHWGGSSAGTTWPGVRMAPVAGEEGLWSYDVPADVTGLIFVRVNGSGDIADWGAKTANLTLPTDGKNLFTITNESATWGDPGCTGEWSTYTPATSGGEETNSLYLWDGVGVTKAEDAQEVGGAAEAVQADGTNIVVGASQKGNWCLKANKGFSNGAYYLGIALDNAVNAGDTIRIAYFRTTNKNTYVLGMDFSADKASAATTHQILVNSDPQVLASNGTPADSIFIVPEGVANAKYVRIYRNSGSTGLWVAKFELVKKVAAEQPETPTVPTVAVTGDMTNWEMDIPFVLADDSLSASLYNDNIKAGTYAFKMKIGGDWRSNGHTYHRGYTGAAGITENNDANMVFTADVEGAYTFTWTFANDSLGIEFPEAPVVIPAKYYITGDSALVGAELQWHPDALKAEQDTMVLNLAAGDYKLKLTVDGDWATAKGYDNLTVKADGLSTDKDNNIIFTLAEAGAVTVIYTNELFKLEGNFYVAPQPKFWIAGGEDIVGEGHGTWSKESALVSYKDTLTMNLAAGAHEFKLITANDEWWGIEHLTDTAAGIYTNEYTNVCFKLAEAGDVNVIYKAGEVFKVEGKFYVAPQAKYYVLGDSALVVNAGLTADKAWTPDAIVALNDTLVLNLAAGDYTMRLSLYGGWDNNKGYESLTDTTAGLREYVDEYENHNIIFTLAEAGAVTIIYNANEFKITGNFYVAPVAKFRIVGDGEQFGNWNPENGLASYKDTLVMHLEAGNYKFKVVVGENWYGYTALTDTAAGLQELDADKNIGFELKEASDVTVIFSEKIFKLIGNFYVEPIIPVVTKDLALVPGVWAADSAVLAAWTWGDEAEGAWSAFEGEGDTLIAKINEKADSVIFVRFEAKAEMDWNSTIWNRTADMKLDSCGIFFVNDWDNYSWCEAPAPVIPAKYYITGDSALVDSLAWNPRAIKAEQDTMVLNLAAGDYKMKITLNGEWETGRGYSSLTEKSEGLSADDDDNIVFTLAEAGAVTVVYNDSVYTVSGNFYVEPIIPIVMKDLALVPGVWATDSAVLAAWTWGAEAEGAWSAFAGEGDTLIAKINEKADSVIFVRFEAKAEMDWNSTIWNRTENLEIDSCGIFFVNDWDNYTWCEAPAPVIPAKYYITGDSALVGTELMWHPDAIKVMEDEYIFENLAAGDYKLKVTVDGDWATGKGYSDLTVKAEGLSTDNDNNVIFTLAEAGNVTVVYNDSVFTVSGNFYVAPAPAFYITGDSALVGAELMWHPDAIKVMEDEYIFENLAAGDYKLKVTVDGDWATGKGYSDLTVKAEGLSTDNDNNIIFTLAEAGNVTVVYNDSVFTLDGDFYVEPVTVEYYAKYAGENGEWNWHALNEAEGLWLTDTIVYYGGGMNINTVADDAEALYIAEIEGVAANDTAFFAFNPADSTLAVTVVGAYVAPIIPEVNYYLKNNWNAGADWTWAIMTKDGENYKLENVVYGGTGVDYNTAESENGKTWVAQDDFLGDEVKAKDTVNFVLNPAAGTITVTLVGAYVVPEVPELEDGFYLVGSMNAWTPAAEYKLAANTESEGEYFIAMAFAENDAFKVVAVANDAITTWYPDNAGDYTVDLNHAGETTVYFRPDYQGAEGWHAGCIFVVPTGTVDIDNTNADVKATKLIINGQLFIEKAGKRYNAQGVLVR